MSDRPMQMFLVDCSDGATLVYAHDATEAALLASDDGDGGTLGVRVIPFDVPLVFSLERIRAQPPGSTRPEDAVEVLDVRLDQGAEELEEMLVATGIALEGDERSELRRSVTVGQA